MKEKKPHLPNCKCDHYKSPLPKKHDWYINSPEHHNCFWMYLEDNNRKHTLSEIAKKLDTSMSVITSIERRALKKMKTKLGKLLKDKK